MFRAFISGALANKLFNGGNAWSRVSWVSGLRRLGWEVCFVEEIGRGACVDAEGAVTDFGKSANVGYFAAVMERFGLAGASALIYEGGEQVWGLPMSELTARAADSAFLFNMSGHLTHPELRSRFRCQVYYDDDPGFTQFWHAAGNAGARLGGHDFYLTLGANIGSAQCPIPTGGIAWHSTRPPVVLDEWPVTAPAAFDRFTTVASWRGAYGPVQHGGRTYGLKVHEFRKFMELPRRTKQPFEIALQIHPQDQNDLNSLRAHGWQIVDPRKVADTPESFRSYAQRSGAEFSAAQGVYVDTQSGWFSDRTVRYLASGRPALVQDTGFSRHIPVGEGLLTFRTLEEAVAGAERIVRDYTAHSRAARRIAEGSFDSSHVIRKLLADLGV